jgi:hypothetical protein
MKNSLNQDIIFFHYYLLSFIFLKLIHTSMLLLSSFDFDINCLSCIEFFTQILSIQVNKIFMILIQHPFFCYTLKYYYNNSKLFYNNQKI